MKLQNQLPAGLGFGVRLVLSSCSGAPSQAATDLSGVSISQFRSESPWTELNGNAPEFDASDLTRTDPFETYSDLDSLGRCGVAYANICVELMPTEEREPIGQVKPTGWHTAKYDGVDGKYLYNRCHLIGFQLAGENANEKNLITGTRYMNTQGMLPFENKVADYVKSTGNHVLYRVTPCLRAAISWPRACRWRRTAWRTRARAFASTSSATMHSRAWALSMPAASPGRTPRWGLGRIL